MLESNYLRWRLEARQFLEHQYWKASACVGDLRPRKFSACVLGSECVCACVLELRRLSISGAGVMEGNHVLVAA